MSAAESMATPQCPTSPSERGSSESRPISVGMSNATDRPPPPAAQQHLVPLVGLHGVAEAGELPDRPRPPAVTRRVQAAGERELAWPADPLEARDDRAVRRPVDRVDGDPGQRGEVGVPHSRARRTGAASAACPRRCRPLCHARSSESSGRQLARLVGRPTNLLLSVYAAAQAGEWRRESQPSGARLRRLMEMPGALRGRCTRGTSP